MIKRPLLAFMLAFFIISAPASDETAYVKNGIRLYKAGHFQKAIVSFQKALNINPENYYALRFSGEAYLKLDDKDSAVEFLQRAYDIKPNPALKKKVAETGLRVYNEGRFFLYPVTFELMLGIAVDWGLMFNYGEIYDNMFRYGGLVSYHFNEWFDLRAGVLLGWGADIYAMPRFSFESPFQTAGIFGIGAGGYANIGSPASGVSDSGLLIAGDMRVVLGPAAGIITFLFQYGLSEAQRGGVSLLFGVGF